MDLYTLKQKANEAINAYIDENGKRKNIPLFGDNADLGVQLEKLAADLRTQIAVATSAEEITISLINTVFKLSTIRGDGGKFGRFEDVIKAIVNAIPANDATHLKVIFKPIKDYFEQCEIINKNSHSEKQAEIFSVESNISKLKNNFFKTLTVKKYDPYLGDGPKISAIVYAQSQEDFEKAVKSYIDSVIAIENTNAGLMFYIGQADRTQSAILSKAFEEYKNSKAVEELEKMPNFSEPKELVGLVKLTDDPYLIKYIQAAVGAAIARYEKTPEGLLRKSAKNAVALEAIAYLEAFKGHCTEEQLAKLAELENKYSSLLPSQESKIQTDIKLIKTNVLKFEQDKQIVSAPFSSLSVIAGDIEKCSENNETLLSNIEIYFGSQKDITQAREGIKQSLSYRDGEKERVVANISEVDSVVLGLNQAQELIQVADFVLNHGDLALKEKLCAYVNSLSDQYQPLKLIRDTHGNAFLINKNLVINDDFVAGFKGDKLTNLLSYLNKLSLLEIKIITLASEYSKKVKFSNNDNPLRDRYRSEKSVLDSERKKLVNDFSEKQFTAEQKYSFNEIFSLVIVDNYQVVLDGKSNNVSNDSLNETIRKYTKILKGYLPSTSEPILEAIHALYIDLLTYVVETNNVELVRPLLAKITEARLLQQEYSPGYINPLKELIDKTITQISPSNFTKAANVIGRLASAVGLSNEFSQEKFLALLNKHKIELVKAEVFVRVNELKNTTEVDFKKIDSLLDEIISLNDKDFASYLSVNLFGPAIIHVIHNLMTDFSEKYNPVDTEEKVFFEDMDKISLAIETTELNLVKAGVCLDDASLAEIKILKTQIQEYKNNCVQAYAAKKNIAVKPDVIEASVVSSVPVHNATLKDALKVFIAELEIYNKKGSKRVPAVTLLIAEANTLVGAESISPLEYVKLQNLIALQIKAIKDEYAGSVKFWGAEKGSELYRILIDEKLSTAAEKDAVETNVAVIQREIDKFVALDFSKLIDKSIFSSIVNRYDQLSTNDQLIIVTKLMVELEKTISHLAKSEFSCVNVGNIIQALDALTSFSDDNSSLVKNTFIDALDQYCGSINFDHKMKLVFENSTGESLAELKQLMLLQKIAQFCRYEPGSQLPNDLAKALADAKIPSSADFSIQIEKRRLVQHYRGGNLSAEDSDYAERALTVLSEVSLEARFDDNVVGVVNDRQLVRSDEDVDSEIYDEKSFSEESEIPLRILLTFSDDSLLCRQLFKLLATLLQEGNHEDSDAVIIYLKPILSSGVPLDKKAIAVFINDFLNKKQLSEGCRYALTDFLTLINSESNPVVLITQTLDFGSAITKETRISRMIAAFSSLNDLILLRKVGTDFANTLIELFKGDINNVHFFELLDKDKENGSHLKTLLATVKVNLLASDSSSAGNEGAKPLADNIELLLTKYSNLKNVVEQFKGQAADALKILLTDNPKDSLINTTFKSCEVLIKVATDKLTKDSLNVGALDVLLLDLLFLRKVLEKNDSFSEKLKPLFEAMIREIVDKVDIYVQSVTSKMNGTNFNAKNPEFSGDNAVAKADFSNTFESILNGLSSYQFTVGLGIAHSRSNLEKKENVRDEFVNVCRNLLPILIEHPSDKEYANALRVVLSDHVKAFEETGIKSSLLKNMNSVIAELGEAMAAYRNASSVAMEAQNTPLPTSAAIIESQFTGAPMDLPSDGIKITNVINTGQAVENVASAAEPGMSRHSSLESLSGLAEADASFVLPESEITAAGQVEVLGKDSAFDSRDSIASLVPTSLEDNLEKVKKLLVADRDRRSNAGFFYTTNEDKGKIKEINSLVDKVDVLLSLVKSNVSGVNLDDLLVALKGLVDLNSKAKFHQTVSSAIQILEPAKVTLVKSGLDKKPCAALTTGLSSGATIYHAPDSKNNNDSGASNSSNNVAKAVHGVDYVPAVGEVRSVMHSLASLFDIAPFIQKVAGVFIIYASGAVLPYLLEVLRIFRMAHA